MTDDEIIFIIRGAIFETFKNMGPGLLESVYEEVLTVELTRRGLKVITQLETPIIYKGKQLKNPLRLDMLVNDRIIVDLKSIEKGLQAVHFSQLKTYLKLMNLHKGILVNFNCEIIDKDNLKTVFNSLCTNKNE